MSDSLISRFLQTGRNGVVVCGSAQTGKTALMCDCLKMLRLTDLYRNSPKGNLAALRYRQSEVKVLNMPQDMSLDIK